MRVTIANAVAGIPEVVTCSVRGSSLVRALEARGIPGVSFHYFDSIGVPSIESMTAEFGGPEERQLLAIERWMERLAGLPGVSVLDGQVRLS